MLFRSVEGGEIYIDDNMTKKFEIGWAMFRNMEVLEAALLPANTSIIASYAFDNCKKLTSYNIPEGVTSIQNSAFRGTSNESVTLPASLFFLDYNDGTLGNLNNINVASGNETYKSKVGVVYSTDEKTLIALPRNRTTYTIPEGVITLGHDCMFGVELSAVVLPASLSTIESRAISDTKLVELTLPANVNTLESYAIVNNEYLQTIIVNVGIPPIFNTESIRSVGNVLKSIYVPNASVTAYKAANGWKDHAAIIKPISEKP